MVEIGCEAINGLGTDAFHGTWYAWPQPWPGQMLLDCCYCS